MKSLRFADRELRPLLVLSRYRAWLSGDRRHVIYVSERGREGWTVPFEGDRTGALDAFLRLPETHDRFAEAVVEYIKDYGPLGICQRHRVIRTHVPAGTCFMIGELEKGIAFGTHLDDLPEENKERDLATRFEEVEWVNVPEEATLVWAEPVEAWVRYVGHLRALMRLAVSARNSEQPDLDDLHLAEAARPADFTEMPFDEIGYPVVSEDEVPGWWGGPWGLDAWVAGSNTADPDWWVERETFNDEDGARSYLRVCLDNWLALGRLALQVSGEMELRVEAREIPGLLAIQLISAVESGVYTCAGCGHPFAPRGQRKPGARQRAWCDQCGRKEQWRDYRRRRKQATEAAVREMVAEEIREEIREETDRGEKETGRRPPDYGHRSLREESEFMAGLFGDGPPEEEASDAMTE